MRTQIPSTLLTTLVAITLADPIWQATDIRDNPTFGFSTLDRPTNTHGNESNWIHYDTAFEYEESGMMRHRLQFFGPVFSCHVVRNCADPPTRANAFADITCESGIAAVGKKTKAKAKKGMVFEFNTPNITAGERSIVLQDALDCMESEILSGGEVEGLCYPGVWGEGVEGIESDECARRRFAACTRDVRARKRGCGGFGGAQSVLCMDEVDGSGDVDGSDGGCWERYCEGRDGEGCGVRKGFRKELV
ncbi:hypothetical protein P280DRAFT_522875 [Massarina eburnea CBS 473.64]|uniref:Ecp2 effector protein domain-containing protein n=1 Tax=Massarina eburnea CBS 473.64 TaxID=1395130 RepID=A0A6A6RKZ7_9PLEO|nr:hypothetical protein P280DRAFT_522875 [Massarina eburnea CBS 473.64]